MALARDVDVVITSNPPAVGDNVNEVKIKYNLITSGSFAPDVVESFTPDGSNTVIVSLINTTADSIRYSQSECNAAGCSAYSSLVTLALPTVPVPAVPSGVSAVANLV